MIPSHLSLVPFCPERRAAMEAIAEVERRRSRGAVSTAFLIFINKVGTGQMYKVLCLLAAMIQFGNPR